MATVNSKALVPFLTFGSIAILSVFGYSAISGISGLSQAHILGVGIGLFFITAAVFAVSILKDYSEISDYFKDLAFLIGISSGIIGLVFMASLLFAPSSASLAIGAIFILPLILFSGSFK